MTILAIVCLCLFAGSVFLYFKKRETRPLSFADVLVFLNWVDIEGFRKLIDPLEEAELRQFHTRNEFGRIQADRITAASEYFRKMGANAKALQDFGYRHVGRNEGRRHPTPRRMGLQRRRCREQSDYLEDTKRLLAHRLINFAVPVKMCCRAGMITLFFWKRLKVLERILISRSLPDLKDLVDETLKAYEELKEAALALARYSEEGMERQVSSRL